MVFPVNGDKETESEAKVLVLNFEAVIDEIDVCGLKPSAVYQTPLDARVYLWQVDQFQAELLLSYFDPLLPKGMRADGCWAGVWRVRTTVPISTTEFRCEWEQGYSWTEHGPESGEWLDAQTWQDNKTMATVGTSDAEALARRATGGDYLSSRWGTVLGYGVGKVDPVIYTKEGLTVSLPEMLPNELCQIHFVIAWAPAPPSSEAARNERFYNSTWYAVDQPPKAIVTYAGCR